MSDLKRFEDLSKLRLDNKPIKCKKVLLEVPVKKPSREDWIRVHTSPDYTSNFWFIELKDNGRDKDCFFVMPDVAEGLGMEPTLVAKTIFTCINRSGDVKRAIRLRRIAPWRLIMDIQSEYDAARQQELEAKAELLALEQQEKDLHQIVVEARKRLMTAQADVYRLGRWVQGRKCGW